MPLAAGDVLYVWCARLADPHDKYCICVCPRRRWFLFINTRPPRAAEAAVPMRPHELSCLTHDSFTDTSFVYFLTDDEIDGALRSRSRHKGPLSNLLKLRIKANVRKHDLLSEEQRQAILAMP